MRIARVSACVLWVCACAADPPRPNAQPALASTASARVDSAAELASSAPDSGPTESHAQSAPALADQRVQCRSSCDATFHSVTDAIAERLGEQVQTCPQEMDNDRSDCLQAVQAELARSTEDAKGTHEACVKDCEDASTGQP